MCRPIVSGTKVSKQDQGSNVDPTQFKQNVGRLKYLNATRSDLMFVVSMISKYVKHHVETHLLATDRILWYLKGTIEMGIQYKNGGHFECSLVRQWLWRCVWHEKYFRACVYVRIWCNDLVSKKTMYCDPIHNWSCIHRKLYS